jgi:phage/plasmid-associated DNA primase
MLKSMPYYTSATKSYGKHIFIKCDEEFHKCKYNFEENEDIEFLCGVGAFMPIDAEIINADSEDFEEYYQLSHELKNYEQPKNEDYVDIEAFEDYTPYHKEILNNIKTSFYSSYDDWGRFIWALKYSFKDEKEALQIADFYSRKAEGYKSFEDVEKTFMSATEKRISWGYLMNLSKKSNENVYFEIISKYNDYLKMDDYNLACIALKLTEGKIIKNDGCIYVYDNPYWLCCDDKKYSTALEHKVSHTLREYYSSVLPIETMKLRSEEPEIREIATKRIDMLNKIIQKINGRGLDGICKYIKIEIQEEDIHFDTYKPFYFCFKNGVAFDLQTNKQVEIKPHHYITQHTTYDYVKSSSEDINLIKKLVESIFPEKDTRECYMSILRSGMIGQIYEKFILANGVGGNGKGLLNDLFSSMLGEMYFYKGNILSLTEKTKGGSSPELASMDKKRFIKFCEPNDNDKLQLGQIKDMTGESKINARMNYSNKTNTILHSTMVLECNKKPKINGRIDNSALRRFINIFFPSIFTDDKDLLKCENHFPKNAYYKTEDFKKRYKYALFHYLLSYEYTDIYEPQSIKDITKEYLFENDEFDMVLNEHVEITENKNDCVSLKDLKNIYRDLQFREGTRNYRGFTAKKFMEKVNESIIWKKYKSLYYKDTIRKSTKEFKGFICMKIRENIDDLENDE